jgi:Cu-Zn family superoxide dismutase
MTLKLVITFETKSDSNVSGTATFIEKRGKLILKELAGLKPGVQYSYS